MREVDAAGIVDRLRPAIFGPHDTLRLFEGPRLTAVETTRLVLFLRLFRIAGVAYRHDLELGRAEADHDFITPAPDAVIRGPASETAALAVHKRVRWLCLARDANQQRGGIDNRAYLHARLHQNRSF